MMRAVVAKKNEANMTEEEKSEAKALSDANEQLDMVQKQREEEKTE